MSLIKLSVTSKLDGIPSWSLEAIDTCPGAAEGGELVEVCRGCYARFGHYAMPTVKDARRYNKQDWQRPEWVSDMVAELRNYRYFRWFDSGDMYHIDLAQKILAVMQQTPWVQHWIPTRMHKFAKFAPVITQMQQLDNVVVRASADTVGGQVDAPHSSMVASSLKTVPEGVKPCLAYLNGGRCSGCRACWDKSVPIVAYIAHGNVMKKVIRIKQEAFDKTPS